MAIVCHRGVAGITTVVEDVEGASFHHWSPTSGGSSCAFAEATMAEAMSQVAQLVRMTIRRRT
jgi:hypothetical protein